MNKATPPPASGYIGHYRTYEAAHEAAMRWQDWEQRETTITRQPDGRYVVALKVAA